MFKYLLVVVLVMMFLTAREQNRDAWLTVENRSSTPSSSNMSMRELRASVIHKVHYLFVAIMLGASGANDETKFDDFIAEFGEMLDLAESVLGPSTSSDGSSQKPVYVFDMNLIPQLHMGVTRCRDRQWRRKALDFLWNLKSTKASGTRTWRQQSGTGLWKKKKRDWGCLLTLSLSLSNRESPYIVKELRVESEDYWSNIAEGQRYRVM